MQNEAKEICEGSKEGFWGMPNKTGPLTDGYLMYSYPKNPTYLLCPTPDNVDMFGIPKNLYFDH